MRLGLMLGLTLRCLPRSLATLVLGMVLGMALAAPAAAQGGVASSLGGMAGGSRAAGAVVTTPQVRAELLAHAPEGVAPGKPLWLGLQLRHKSEWHTYWKNPGDSGLPTQLEWQLPAGLQAGDIAWPLPSKIAVGTLANYGYEGTVLLPVPVQVSEAWRPAPSGELLVRLKASWLVCRKECIPEDGEFSLTLPVRGSTALHGAAFEAAARAAPVELPPHADNAARVSDRSLAITVQGLPAAVQGKPLEFFPEVSDLIQTAAPGSQRWEGEVWTAQIPLSPQRSASPQSIPLVLAFGNQGWRAELKVLGAWPATAAPAGVSPELEAALKANAQTQAAAAPASAAAGLQAVLLALTGALVGGLILNLMPCVFPVLALKVMGFARKGQQAHALRVNGLSYSAGVVLSFMALGALMLSLRAAGESVGWGFQLQSPVVVAALAALFTLLGLNLAGVFEFGQFLPSRLLALHARHPAADAFLSGVLAVAVASPCTAPFMGASLGFAITFSTPLALAVFAMLGVGMALPYLAASWWPALAARLPRPGPWMDHFRRLMAFPMFATVVWLVWVLGQQTGINGASALLLLLVGLSLLVWTITLSGRARIVLVLVALLAGAALLHTVGPQVLREPASAAAALRPAPAGAPTPADAAAAADGWQAWSAERVAQGVAQGRTVFVDFTAAWCVTCQYNKQTTLSDPEVLKAFAAGQVLLLRADWTRRDPAITAALSAMGRSGVPVYAVYRAGQPTRLLPEILTVAEVRAAIHSP